MDHYLEYVSKLIKNILLKGTMAAAIQLLKSVGADIIECLVIIELTSLKGRNKLDVPCYSLVQFND
jgi:adenine phosphoribosyltransferase